MLQKLFSIYDSAAQAYSSPFALAHRQQAIRTIEHHLKDPNSQISHNPSDFTLFIVGEFDTDNGTLVPLKTPEKIITALELKNIED